MRYINGVVLCVMFFVSCSQEMSVNVPQFSGGGRLVSALPVEAKQIQLLNGVYDVIEGTEQLGKKVVIKQSGTSVSMFTGKNAGMFIFHYGRVDSTLIFEGYWRYTQGSETGLAQFEIPSDSMGKRLLQGIPPTASFTILGTLGEESMPPSTVIRLQYQRPILDTSFSIIAHRGGGRNSDRLPASENSLGIITIAEQFGTTGIEIDVRLTKDGVPILFHDDNFSPRLVNTEYCIGPVSNFTFAAIRTLCTLKNGEPVPTLDEALNAVLTKTTLSVVWIDIKSPEAVAPAAKLQAEYSIKAAAAGRSLKIYLGLSTDELIEEYKKQQLVSTTDALCELSLSDVRTIDAKIWAPRWTLGPLPAEANQMRSEGRKTFVWTLDQREFILPFITGDAVDGILTNYPALVAFEFYVLR